MTAAARRTLVAVALGASFLSTHGAYAQTVYTGTFPGGATTNFSAAGLPSGGSAPGDTLNFTTSGSGDAIGTDDVTAVLDALNLAFSNGNALTLNQGAGSTINLDSGATITLSNAAALTNNLNTTLAGATTFTGAGSATFGGVISGAGSLSQNGTGTLTLTNANTYTGATTVNSGTLALQNTYQSPSFAIGSNATLELNVASGQTDDPTSTFTGTGTLRKTGTGTVIWQSGAATFAQGAGGLIDIQGGTFIGGSFGNEDWTNNLASMNIASGATYNGVEAQTRVDALTGAGTFQGGYGGTTTTTIGVANGSGTFFGVIQDNGGAQLALTKTGTGTETLTGANTYSGGTTVSSGHLTFVNNHSGSSSFVDNATLEFNNTAQQQLNGGTLSGTGTLIKSGSGTLLLGANGSVETVAMTGGLIDVQGGLLRNEYSNGNWTNNKAGLEVDGGATVDLWDSPGGITVDALTGSGTVTHTSYGGAENFTVGVNNGSGTFSGTITNASSGNNGVPYLNLVKSGTGTETLTGTNTYTGGTTVNSGTLALANGGSAGTVQGNVTVNTGGTLSLTAGDALGYDDGNQVTNLYVNGGTVDNTTGSNEGYHTNFILTGGTMTSTGGGYYNINASDDGGIYGITTNASANTSLISSGISVRGGSLNFNVAQGTTASGIDLLVSGPIINNAITKTGAGVLALTGANTYSGGTTVSVGTLVAENDAAALGTGNTSIGSGATLQLDDTGTLIRNATTFTGTGTLLKTGAGTETFGNFNSVVNVSLNAGGLIDVEGGSLETSSFGNGNWGNNLASLNIGNSGNVQLKEHQVIVDALTGSGTLTQTFGGPGIEVGVANGSGTFSGVIGGGGNTLNFHKVGTGTETLSNTNSYAGGTTVNGGTVALTAAGADGTGVLTVNGGDTVTVSTTTTGTGAGSALGAGGVVLNGGTLQNAKLNGTSAAGDGSGTNNYQNGGLLTLASGKTSVIDFGAGNTGAVFSFTDLAFTAGNTAGTVLDVNNWNGNFTDGTNGGDGVDQLLFGTQLTSAELGDIVFTNPAGYPAGTNAPARQLADGEVAAAPEPSQVGMLALMGLGLGGLILRAKKRRVGEASVA